MKLKLLMFSLSMLFISLALNGQSLVKGYVYETGNRGYISDAKLTVLESNTKRVVAELVTNPDGLFETQLQKGNYILRAEHKIFFSKSMDLEVKEDGKKYFPNLILDRKPGYIFDITVALKDPDGKFSENRGGLDIEVYNNTRDSMVLVLNDYANPDFQFTMEQGNHYSYLIRKKGYYSKSMEAYVNVKGCILCFDGIGNVKPGVTDNLTEGLQMGTLLANIELQPVLNGKSIKLDGVYFNMNSVRLKSKTVRSLDAISEVLKTNPQIVIEIGAHSDSRGEDLYNFTLSEKRARSVVKYLINAGVKSSQLMSKGYGETKLMNKCKNDVPCTDEQHGENRRVEFVVVQSVNSNNDFSLMKMKEEQRMARLLEEVLNQEVVQIGGGPMPDDLEKKIDTEKDKTTKEVKEKIVDKKETTKVIKEKLEAPVFEEQVIIEQKPVVKEAPVVEKKVTIKESPVVKDISSQMDLPKTKVKTTTTKMNKRTSSIHYVQPKPNAPHRISSIVDVKSLKKNGYSIRLGRSKSQINENDKLLSNHGVVYEQYCTDGSYNYLVGLFSSKENANQFLKKFIKPRYPDADIIYIEK